MVEVSRRTGTARRFLLTTALVGAVTGAGLATGPAAQAAPATAVQPAASSSSSANWADATWGDAILDLVTQTLGGKNNPDTDPGSLASVTTTTGARAAWATKDASGRAVTGKGVDVALLDTGISTDVQGLDSAGKVVAGPDLSIDANSTDLQGGDNYGHGTHLAGIIAGRDNVATDPKTGQPKPSSSADQLGEAPDARLVSVKLATRDGSTDVSQVIAGIDWVVQHRNDNGMKIRVINLSYGTDSAQPYITDPLAAAVENAWRKGIVVVVSAGNDGPTATRLSDPAIDPYVIAVGASDTRDPSGKVTVADFSSRGTWSRHADLLAPGASIASLRAPGSFVDTNYPEGRVAGDTSGRLFRGSGTSQSAAVVSGAVALMLQANPSLTPDQVKSILTRTATGISGAGSVDAGAGEINVSSAVQQAKGLPLVNNLLAVAASVTTWLTAQAFAPASGLGTLEAARGTSHLVDPDTGASLTGEVDVQGQRWSSAAWRVNADAGTSWTGGTYNGAVWTGDGWQPGNVRWANATWSGQTWTGVRWKDVSWDGVRWKGVRWSGVRWKDNGWL